MHITYTIATTPLGNMLVARTERGICRLAIGAEHDLATQLQAEFSAADISRDDAQLGSAVEAILAYLNGSQPHLDLPLDLQVTAFQRRVLEALQTIPYGETRSYGDIAQTIDKPKAARAVGNACKSNPVPLVVPCHRVVRSDGSIEGYVYGTSVKEQLLKMEQAPTK